MKYHRDDYSQFLFDEACAEADERDEDREWRRGAQIERTPQEWARIHAELNETRRRMEEKKRAR